MDNAPTFFLARRYALAPKPAQAAQLESMMWRLRELWNDGAALVEHTRYWQRFAGWSRPFPMPQLGHIWRTWQEIKRLDPTCELARLPSAPVSALSRTFDRAMREGWKAVKAGKPPRWPRRKRVGDPLPSIEFPIWVGLKGGRRHCNVKFGRDTILFPNARGTPPLGRVAYTRHQKLVGEPKTARILKAGSRWYSAVSCEVPLRPQQGPRGEAVGVHLGIVHHVTVSDGARYELLRAERKAQLEERIRQAQQRVSRAQRGSKRRRKRAAELAELHADLAALRRGRQHEITAAIADRAGTVVMENWEVKRMTRAEDGVTTRNREFLAVAPAQFRTILAQKLERRGGHLLAVDPAYTSSTCMACGHVDRRSRRGATKFTCTACGYSVDADFNAAQTILVHGIGRPPPSGGDGSGPVTAPRETDNGGHKLAGRKSQVRQNSLARASMPRESDRNSLEGQTENRGRPKG